jgi:Arc/MetJ-type ribon-helix-helix transcriptional regulator
MPTAFPPEIERFVEHELAAGEFSSRDELIVTAVDLLRQRKADLDRLRGEIAEGLQGEGIPGSEVFARLRAKYATAQLDQES